jgi:hypothetical protein
MGALRRNGLSVFFLVLFAVTLVGHAVAGHAEYNDQQVDVARLTGDPADKITLGTYVTSSHFAQAVMENWQSEWLQFVLFIVAAIWFVQKGSTESKRTGQAGLESDEEQRVGEHADADSPLWARVGGLRTTLYSWSLTLVFLAFFLGSWLAQSLSGWSAYNSDQLDTGGHTISWAQYLAKGEFWSTTLQNWQSEFLAVGSMVVLSVYLRQRGSPQSKPVGAPHEATAEEG